MSQVLKTMNGYSAKVVADNLVKVPYELNPVGYDRIITFVLVFPRMVLAEFNTHRYLSRNSASSRAKPIRTMLEAVINNPFVPDRFPRKHKGMVADEWVTQDEPEYYFWVEEWLKARDQAVNIASRLYDLGISKQITNRILEPFMWHEVIVTGTEWSNFFALRAHHDAQNEIRIIAELALAAYNESTPAELVPGQWHLPFGDQFEEDKIAEVSTRLGIYDFGVVSRMVTTARCARVSYKTFDGTSHDYDADIDLFTRLFLRGHWSPFEHVAQAMTPREYRLYKHTTTKETEYGWCGNFRGFIQLRKQFDRNVENRPDPRMKVIAL